MCKQRFTKVQQWDVLLGDLLVQIDQNLEVFDSSTQKNSYNRNYRDN